ncbi:polysaccharide biosynthesis protein [Dokdonella sp.]|uniref:polysaccharide biosynthesis protein n=1 Tax=Dokdonella sp. TaxID=2291710 RepID=UPI0031C4B248|nr:polysaccharide biosynthesis protein [Dokdonella sp.]
MLRKLIGAIHPRLAVVVHDMLMVWIAWTLVSMIRWSLAPNPQDVSLFGVEAWLVLAAQGLIFWWTGLYRGLWRFASMPDIWNIARACLLGALAVGITLFLYNRLASVPRTVLAVYPLLLAVLLGGPRMLYRYWKDSRLDFGAGLPSLRVLVLGAGKAGDALVRDLKRENRYIPVGFLDDNAKLRGARLHGIPVLGSLDQLPRIARETAAEMVVIAMPSANKAEMHRALDLCEASKLPFRTVPRLEDVVAGRSSFNELKEVAIEDLLGREPVHLDWTAIRTGLAGRRVLVTGGGGSIGAELCRQVARLGAESLTVLEQCEFNLYTIGHELQRDFPDLMFNAWLGDCGDAMTAERVFAAVRPQIVFHAAAYKHVPLLQGQVREAVRNNVLATRVVAEAADRHGAESFVLISTDKAVNPTSVMGACKRVAEIFCQNFAARSRTRFITVRFGNVLDSAGSVVPLFREQIRAGGPLTVTHPEITRYFMTIPEACQLILQASVLGQGGEIFALDMGEPVRIRDLAEQMIRLAGQPGDQPIGIIYTGLRPGEKLFEELFHPQEHYSSTGHAKILLAQPRCTPWNQLHAQLQQCEAAARDFDEPRLRRILEQLLPEFPGNVAAQDGIVIPLGPRLNRDIA